ncbi:MAG TPA: response regulator, partial [Terriglobales bacterium]
DVAMPGLTGPAAYAQMCVVKNGLPVIFTTGHTAESAALESLIESGAMFLQKPYAPDALRQAVRGALDRRVHA